MFEILPWEARREIESLTKQMDRLWGSFFGKRNGVEPAMDLTETKDSLIVKAELPGMDPKDVEITLSGNLLSIRGERKQEREEKEEICHLIERFYSSFVRSIKLPVEVEEDKIETSYKDGLLKLVLPKSEKAKKKEIKIELH
jgi:HSP20 family protein